MDSLINSLASLVKDISSVDEFLAEVEKLLRNSA